MLRLFPLSYLVHQPCRCPDCETTMLGSLYASGLCFRVTAGMNFRQCVTMRTGINRVKDGTDPRLQGDAMGPCYRARLSKPRENFMPTRFLRLNSA